MTLSAQGFSYFCPQREVVYKPDAIELRIAEPPKPQFVSLVLAGDFYNYRYSRQGLFLKATKIEGSGEVTPFLPELFWRFREGADEVVVRAELEDNENGELEAFARRLRFLGEDVVLLGPRFGQQYEFYTTVRSLDLLESLLSRWGLEMGEYFVIYYLRTKALPSFKHLISAMAFRQKSQELLFPFLEIAECVVADESDKERNLFAIYAPSQQADRLVLTIKNTSREFNIRLLQAD